MNSLTLTQMMQGLKIIGALTTDFGSLDNAKAALAPVMDVAMNNLGPIFNQVCSNFSYNILIFCSLK